jgi:oxalate decarboxylase/phosphoglucose isomerase-like protein (cupin superfamily)
LSAPVELLIVPAGARHNVINTGEKSLKLYTLYGPPEHRDGVVHTTRPDVEAAEDHFNGSTTEVAAVAPSAAKGKAFAKSKAKKPRSAKAVTPPS